MQDTATLKKKKNAQVTTENLSTLDSGHNLTTLFLTVLQGPLFPSSHLFASPFYLLVLLHALCLAEECGTI